MNDMQVFNNPRFGEIRTITENGKTLFCGADVARALGYKKPNDAIAAHCRYTVKRSIPHPQSLEKKIEMNFIPEGDIYRLAAKSELPGADEFESWIFDEVIPSIRKTGSYSVKPMSDYQRQCIGIQKAKLLYQIAAGYDGTYKQVLQAYATKELTGEFLLPLPALERKTYSAAEIGSELGISAHKVGTLANANRLKTDEYGKWFVDKSAHSSKEVQSFRYYENVIPILRGLI